MPSDLDRLLAIPAEQVAVLPPADREAYVVALERARLTKTPSVFGAAFHHDFKRWRHVDLMAAELADMIDNDSCDVLIVEVSVRHGKSRMFSEVAPVWFLSRFPTKTVGLASYESDFAQGWGRKARSLMEKVAPAFSLEVDKRSAAASRWELTSGGGMWTAGAGGPIEGKGYHLGIIDDAIKNREIADSALMRDQIWDWWESTFVPRGEPGAKIVIVMSRWHEDDLIGRLKAQSTGKRVKTIRLPALAEEDDDPLGRQVGEALCPERYNEDDLLTLKESVGPWTWSARYQQRPQPIGGGIFKSDQFRYWTRTDRGFLLDAPDQVRLVDPDECYRFAVCDLAFTRNKKSDYTVLAHFYASPNGDLILVDRERVRVEGPDHLPMLHRAWNRDPKPHWIGVEKTTSSLSLIGQAIRDGIIVRELKPEKNKSARAETAATLLANGRVFFPKHATWLDEWEAELLGFPSAAHDDQVDVLSYAAIELGRGTVRGRGPTPHEPASLEEHIRRQMVQRQRRKSRHPILGRY